ncbi:hypothetical protein BD626DRAFT_455862 [Schizophyllum amplum]|uniref:SPRY domain-containing protein n=1 Tax=Schizophyllum amplum TaxID=97359 RepID=A0A550CI63_9AGAR|nr:hypothetical protein BD626DRAFT_455862 [Auriculariopsis ampla]
MNFLKHLKGKGRESDAPPPAWAPAPESSYKDGLINEAPEDEYEGAEEFCSNFPPDAPRLIPTAALEAMQTLGCRAWGIEHPNTPRFIGRVQRADETKGGAAVVRVQTLPNCLSVCLLSDMPIVAGLYNAPGKQGAYFELKIHRMDGIISIGTACRPYPSWRHPGWNRLSAALHLDDLRKFFEDPNGGRDYHTDNILTRVRPGDVLGCGYELVGGRLFFTYNGVPLPPAFTGIYMPKHQYDVFAAIGVEGACDFDVNFGGDMFVWKPANEWAWRVEGSVGNIAGPSGEFDDELPTYEQSRA